MPHPVRFLPPGVSFKRCPFANMFIFTWPQRTHCLLALFLLSSELVWAQPSGESAATSSVPGSSVPQVVASARPHPVTLAAAQQGVLACSGRINQVANFLGLDDKSGAMLMLPPAQQDQRFAAIALE